MQSVLDKLKGGDRRSNGRVDEVVENVLADPRLFQAVFEGMLSEDPLLRMRCADAIEKISARHPEYLAPYKSRLLAEVARVNQQEVRWHVAQMFSRLELDANERRIAYEMLLDYLNDTSSIVRTFAMQALADIAATDSRLRPGIVDRLQQLTETGTPAMKNQGRKLLVKLRL